MSAGHYKLSNLIAIVDRNKVQIDGSTEEVMQLEPLKDKWESFNWQVLECDGNSIADILATLDDAGKQNKPCVILAHTRMGAGVASIENDYRWHGKAPNDEELKQFMEELEHA